MPRERVAIGVCPKCGVDGLVCSYNYFSDGDLTIDSWEHKCGDCGFRDTIAYRSDDDDLDASVPRQQCPFCQREAGKDIR